jgi:membrane-associated phospholipid phosphatase
VVEQHEGVDWQALERASIVAGIIAFYTAGYFGVGLSTDPTKTDELATPADGLIPFIASSVWVYLGVFPIAFAPVFLVKSPLLFRRAALAYVMAIAVSLICFRAFPVSATKLRAAPSVLDVGEPSEWVVSLLYCIDPPYNLFPSLHVSIAFLAAYSTWKASRGWGAALFVTAGLISVAVCTVKQHFLLDVLGGLALSTFAAGLFLRLYRSSIGDAPTYSWRGPAAYLAFVIAFYGGLYAAFRVSPAAPCGMEPSSASACDLPGPRMIPSLST